jgi:hypothetical protein
MIFYDEQITSSSFASLKEVMLQLLHKRQTKHFWKEYLKFLKRIKIVNDIEDNCNILDLKGLIAFP